jgi:hypothetical protein
MRRKMMRRREPENDEEKGGGSMSKKEEKGGGGLRRKEEGGCSERGEGEMKKEGEEGGRWRISEFLGIFVAKFGRTCIFSCFAQKWKKEFRWGQMFLCRFRVKMAVFLCPLW